MIKRFSREELDRLIQIHAMSTGLDYELIITQEQEGENLHTDYTLKSNNGLTPLGDSLIGAVLAMETLIGLDPVLSYNLRVKLSAIAVYMNGNSLADNLKLNLHYVPFEVNNWFIRIEIGFAFTGKPHETSYTLLETQYDKWDKEFIAGLLYSKIAYAIANGE